MRTLAHLDTLGDGVHRGEEPPHEEAKSRREICQRVIIHSLVIAANDTLLLVGPGGGFRVLRFAFNVKGVKDGRKRL